MKKIGKQIVVLMILLILCISLCSCTALSGLFGSANQSTVHIDIDDLDSTTVGTVVANNCLDSCVRIISDFGSTEAAGSGFIITEDGYVVTNRHVVVLYRGGSDLPSSIADTKLSATYQVVFSDNTYLSASLVSYSTNEYLDIAILKIAGSGEYTPLQLDQTSDVIYGQQVYTIGNPENIGVVLSSMMVSSPSIKMNSAASYYTILLDGNVNHGNSGGALIDSHSHVIGVIYARIESESGTNNVYGLGCAIKIKDVISYIKTTSSLKSAVAYQEYVPE